MPKSKTEPEVNDFFNVRPSTSIPAPQRPSLTPSHVMLRRMPAGEKGTSPEQLRRTLLRGGAGTSLSTPAEGR